MDLVAEAIEFTAHSLARMKTRGTDRQEVVLAILSGGWTRAQGHRRECRMDFPYNADWNGKTYGTKQVNPIFALRGEGVLVITVKTFYF